MSNRDRAGRVDLANARSFLFAPGSDERKLTSAFRRDADAVVLDLEDAVAPQEKEGARATVAAALADPSPGPLRVVRVNGVRTEFFRSDLELVHTLELDAIMLPKATPEDVDALGPDGPPVIAIVESALGLHFTYEIAARPRVAALMLGGIDLAADVGLRSRPDGAELLYPRARVACGSAAAGVRPPIDVVHTDIPDLEGLRTIAGFARDLGYGGKACIHPSHIETINEVFGTANEAEWARDVIAAYEAGLREGLGAVAMKGEMIDLAVVEHARAILARGEAR